METELEPQIHGGDLDRARARFGGARADWLDLSTGINAAPYPAAPPPLDALARLPDRALNERAEAAARAAYGAPVDAEVVATAGAQAAIETAPRLAPRGRVAILQPTYSEHAAAFRRAGWTVEDVVSEADAEDADALVVVNPNNPTGHRLTAEATLALIRPNRLLIVDESFADVAPDISVAGAAGRPGLMVLRSFGKFYGLAGLRLGFALTDPALGARLRAALGPWPVSGPALAIGAAALADDDWRVETRRRLAEDGARLDALAAARGWRPVGGCDLFRTVECGDAAAVQEALARRRIWTRRFDYAPSWLRFGLPGDAAGWARLEAAVEELGP